MDIFLTKSQFFNKITLKGSFDMIDEKDIKKLREENASLVSKKGKLEDPNYVQTYARGNYMFSKDGEQIFYLPSDLDREPSSTITPTTNPEE